MPGLIENISKRLAGFRGSTAVRPTETAGVAVEEMFGSGYIEQRERSPRLRGKRRWSTYNDLVHNTVIVAASVRYFLNLLANAEWTVQPPTDEEGEPLPGAQEAADFVKDVMFDMETSWSRIIRRAAMFRFNGFSVQEWTAKKREDGRIGMLDVESRPCSTIERWDLEGGNTVLGVTQNVNGKEEIYLPRGKIIYLVDDSLEVSPEGTGLFRHLVRSAERLKAYEELEELAFETDLRGIPVGWAPIKELRDSAQAGTLTTAQVSKARQAVDQFVKNKLRTPTKGLVLDSETYNGTTPDGAQSPSGTKKWGVELLQGNSTAQTEAAAAIQRINREMATLLGTEHLLLGSDGTGSLALGWTKLSSFFLIVSSTLGEIAEAYDRDFIKPVCELNGIPKELWPKLRAEDIDVTDVEAVTSALSQLASAGATLQPDDPAIDVIRGRMGLPPAPEPPELSEEDQALVDRMRAGLPPEQLMGPEEESAGGYDESVPEIGMAKRLLKSILGSKDEDDHAYGARGGGGGGGGPKRDNRGRFGSGNNVSASARRTSTVNPDKAKGKGKGGGAAGSKPADATPDEMQSHLGGIAPGGVEGRHQLDNDPDLGSIKAEGKTWVKGDLMKSKAVLGNDGECHWNTGKLYNEGKIDSIAIGYARNEYGWHQHTWGMKGGKVVETTASNLGNTHWHGKELSPEQSKRFADFLSKPENAPGNGNVRTKQGGRVI